MKTTLLLLAIVTMFLVPPAQSQVRRLGKMLSTTQTLPASFHDGRVKLWPRQGELSLKVQNNSTTDTLYFQICTVWADTATVASDSLNAYVPINPSSFLTIYYTGAAAVKFGAAKRSGSDTTSTYSVIQQ